MEYEYSYIFGLFIICYSVDRVLWTAIDIIEVKKMKKMFVRYHDDEYDHDMTVEYNTSFELVNGDILVDGVKIRIDGTIDKYSEKPIKWWYNGM